MTGKCKAQIGFNTAHCKAQIPGCKAHFQAYGCLQLPQQAFVRCRKFAKRGGAREREKGKERKKEKRKKRGKGEKRVISLKLNDFYVYLLVFITILIERSQQIW
jgi:hypothetical protein